MDPPLIEDGQYFSKHECDILCPIYRSKSQAQFEKTAESREEGLETPDSMQNPEESLPWQPLSDPNLPYYISTMKERLTSLSSLEEQIAQLAR